VEVCVITDHKDIYAICIKQFLRIKNYKCSDGAKLLDYVCCF